MGDPVRCAGMAVAIVCLLASLAGCGGSGETVELRESPETNIAALERLGGSLAVEIASLQEGALGDTVFLQVDSTETAWVVRGGLINALSQAGTTVLLPPREGSEAATVWRVDGVEMGVRYENIRKPGLFSGAFVDRTVMISYHSEIVRAGEVLWSGRMQKLSTDTILEDQVESIENTGIPQTRGTLPELDTIDRYIEPFVIIGATGAAIFLFFQVRS